MAPPKLPQGLKEAMKIARGTPQHDQSDLCESCAMGQIHETVSGKTTKICHAYGEGQRLYEKIVRCSSYMNKTLPTLQAMEEIAWVLKTDAKRKTVGFSPPPKEE